MNKEYLIGVDITATYVEIGLVDLSGKLLKKIRDEITGKETRNELIDKIVGPVNKLRKGHVVGVGLSTSGFLDLKRGYIIHHPRISILTNTPIKRLLEEELKLPVFIDNNANCFTLAEYKVGHAKKIDNVIGVLVGKGIGGGIILNGKIFRGSQDIAGEIGKMVVSLTEGKNNKLCSAEYYASAEGMEQRFKAMTNKTMKVGEILKLAKKDKKAKDLVTEAGDALGALLINLINIFNPDLLLVGGQLSGVRAIVDPAIKLANKHAIAHATKNVKITVSKMPDAGIIGAASIIRR